MLIYDFQSGDDPFGPMYKSSSTGRTKIIPASVFKSTTSSSLKNKKSQPSKCSKKKFTKANKAFLKSLGLAVKRN